MPKETLTCKKCGQNWTRERTRGIKPKQCNRCKALRGSVRPAKKNSELTQGFPPEINSNSLGGLTEPLSRVSEDMLDLLTGDERLEREWLRKADYVVGQLDDPRILVHRDEKDLSMLVGIQKDLVRQHRSRLRTAA